jgi:hypothetical protein
MTEDEQYRGYELIGHEVAGEWRAPYTPLGQRFRVGAYGSGQGRSNRRPA